jgi:hypothetical protein
VPVRFAEVFDADDVAMRFAQQSQLLSFDNEALVDLSVCSSSRKLHQLDRDIVTEVDVASPVDESAGTFAEDFSGEHVFAEAQRARAGFDE